MHILTLIAFSASSLAILSLSVLIFVLVDGFNVTSLFLRFDAVVGGIVLLRSLKYFRFSSFTTSAVEDGEAN